MKTARVRKPRIIGLVAHAIDDGASTCSIHQCGSVAVALIHERYAARRLTLGRQDTFNVAIVIARHVLTQLKLVNAGTASGPQIQVFWPWPNGGAACARPYARQQLVLRVAVILARFGINDAKVQNRVRRLIAIVNIARISSPSIRHEFGDFLDRRGGIQQDGLWTAAIAVPFIVAVFSFAPNAIAGTFKRSIHLTSTSTTSLEIDAAHTRASRI